MTGRLNRVVIILIVAFTGSSPFIIKADCSCVSGFKDDVPHDEFVIEDITKELISISESVQFGRSVDRDRTIIINKNTTTCSLRLVVAQAIKLINILLHEKIAVWVQRFQIFVKYLAGLLIVEFTFFVMILINILGDQYSGITVLR